MIEYLIAGSGFTASVICIHLIDTGINPKKITVIGPTKLGQGNAFNCPNDEYRLNVRSEIMWIYPEKKSEFTNWAKKEIIDNEGKWADSAKKVFMKKFKNGPSDDLKESIKQKSFLQNRGFSFKEIESVFFNDML